MSRMTVRKVAVLGAGVMGAQIATHCANADVPVVLFDLPAKEGDPNGIVRKALAGLKKLQPAPAATKAKLAAIEAANYESDLEKLRDCDLIIEAIAEKMEWKLDLYQKVAPFIRPDAIFASNTSGLSISLLSEGMPSALRGRFCGIHFFNPPRYMALVELIATPTTDPAFANRIAFDFTCLHTCQANSRSARSSAVGSRSVTHFHSSVWSAWLSRSCANSPPEILRKSLAVAAESPAEPLAHCISRTFCFHLGRVVNISNASSSKPGAMIASMNRFGSHSFSAVAASSTRLKPSTDPNALTGSPA